MNALLSTGLVLASQGQELNYLFDLSAQLLQDAILMIIAVFVLFLVASKLLFNPVRDMLKKRQEKIKSELETAEKSMTDADALKADYEEKIKNINKEAELILSEARKKALDNENKIVAEAKKEAALVMEQAKKEAELEKRKVRDEVKNEMIHVAAMMAEKVTSGAITGGIQDELVDETLKEIGESAWQS